MLTLGVQTERLRNRLFSCPFCFASLYLARVSSEVALKTRYTNWSSNEAAIPTGSGKTVTLPLFARPCNASLHQLNFLMPMRGMASDMSHIKVAFSSKVKRDIKSLALSSELKLGFLYGSCCAHKLPVSKMLMMIN